MEPSHKQVSNRPPVRSDAPSPAEATPVEATLDDLLLIHKRRKAEAARAGPHGAPTDPLEKLRSLFRTELIPSFRAIADKYAGEGIQLKMETGGFVRGGREILIDIRFEGYGLRLTGTVMPDRIAFQETRYSGDVPGAVTSGSTLPARSLSAGRFREFVYEHISALVRSVLRQSMRSTSGD